MFSAKYKIQNTRYKIQAFTLIELVIVIGIMAVLATFGFFNIIEYKNRQELTSTSQQIVAVLRNSQDRSLAQENGSRWGVHFENPVSGSDFYTLFQGSSYATGIMDSQSVLPPGVQFNNPSSGSSLNIVFFPITGLPDSSSTIKISLVNNATVSSTITISSNGKIQF